MNDLEKIVEKWLRKETVIFENLFRFMLDNSKMEFKFCVRINKEI